MKLYFPGSTLVPFTMRGDSFCSLVAKAILVFVMDRNSNSLIKKTNSFRMTVLHERGGLIIISTIRFLSILAVLYWPFF